MSGLSPVTQEKLTHYGWFMFCPVLLGNIESETPIIVPKYLGVAPLFWLAYIVQSCVIGLCSMCFQDYEPMWYFKVTGDIPCGKE